MRLILLGPPGAGKGTQGERLARRLGVPRYATGDILREAVRADTRVGREARGYMDRGALVPDELVTAIVLEALAAPAAARGFVLDGFPRNPAQADALDGFLAERGTPLDGVVLLEVPEAELVRRLTGRRVCPSCGATYNVHAEPPRRDEVCDRCGARLETRRDDDEATVRQRLRVYAEQTAPLVERYERSGVPFHRVVGTGSVEEIEERLRRALGV
jgi:adenylate kinase